jgi:hypothetical protein
MNKPPTVVRVQGPTWEAVLEVPGIYGDAAGVAARLRGQGLAAQRRKGEVLVNANHIPENLL